MIIKLRFKNLTNINRMYTSAIAIYDETDSLIDKTTVDILYDDFTAWYPCKEATFTDTPVNSSSVYCGIMVSAVTMPYGEVIFKIPNDTISIIGLGTMNQDRWDTDVSIFVLNENTNDFEFLTLIELRAKIDGLWTVISKTVNYTSPDPIEINDTYSPIMIGQNSGLNSVIYKNPQERHLFDLSLIGTAVYESELIQINQENHYFEIGDVLFYNVTTNKFEKALAENSMLSEVCGVVSKIISLDYFEIVTTGLILTDRYSFDEGTVLYLSDATTGKLVSIAPADIIKQVATCVTNGIIVDIKRAYKLTDTTSTDEYEAYTQTELDEIINNIW